MTTETTTRWIDAARYALEHKTFVMVEPDGSWHPPNERDWAAMEGPELAEYSDTEPTDTTGTLLDTFTASMLVQIHDALGDVNRERFAGMSLLRAVDVGWKLTRKGTA